MIAQRPERASRAVIAVAFSEATVNDNRTLMISPNSSRLNKKKKKTNSLGIGSSKSIEENGIQSPQAHTFDFDVRFRFSHLDENL